MKTSQFKKKVLSVIALLVVTMISSNSCKKENLAIFPSTTRAQASGIAMETVDFARFSSSVTLTKLGALGQRLSRSSPGNRLQSIIDDSSLGTVAVYTDSIIKFTDSTGVNYVFKMALSSPRAVSFRNLTVFVSTSGKTSAFIATYSPTQEWVDSLNKKQPTHFSGKISVAPLNLLSTTLTSIQSTDNSQKVTRSMSIGKPIMVAEEICYNYRVFEIVQVRCNGSQGHSWAEREQCPIWHGVEEGIPPYTYILDEIRTTCFTVDMGDNPPGGGGGNGGGGTYPTPPGGYDPCGGAIPTQSIIGGTKGLRLQTVPPSDCDPIGGGGGGSVIDPTPSLAPVNPIITVDLQARSCVGSLKNMIVNSANLQASVHNAVNTYPTNTSNAISILSKITTFNITINEATLPDKETKDANGQVISTARTNASTSPTTGDITLNKTMLDEATDLAVLSTIIHEMMHSYFVYGATKLTGTDRVQFEDMNKALFDPENSTAISTNGPLLGSLQHFQMANSYITSMGSLLKDIADKNGIKMPNGQAPTEEYCKDLFWHSLQQTSGLQPPNPTQVSNNGNKEFKKQSGSSIQKGC